MKWYAVVSGKKPGIYTTWSETQENVSGFSGAIFKSFETKKEAEDFFHVSSPKKTKSDEEVTYKTRVFTDGSFAKGRAGFGVVIFLNSGKKITAFGKVPLEKVSNNVAELYAIYVALSLIKGDISIFTDSQYSISCLTSYIHLWRKNGWKDVSNEKLIQAIDTKMEGRKVSFTYIEAHAGHEFNEEADELANKGRLQEKDLIVGK